MDKLKLLFVLLLSVVMPIKVSKQIDVVFCRVLKM